MYPDRKDGIRDVLVRQFELHEVRWSLSEGAEPSTTHVPPLAHAVQDIYKCLHQGTFGVGHIIDNAQNFRGRLLSEILRAKSVREEPSLERVSPDGLVLRVNLRPFRALFKDNEQMGCELLLDVCVKSAAITTGFEADFLLSLESFGELNTGGQLKAGGMVFAFPEYIVDGFMREVRTFVSKTGFFPVLSHSPTYRSLNEPSYRVVHATVLEASPLAAWIQAADDMGSGYVN
ncbi:MAG: hypothetical protein P4L43_00030 [Syntrophobacteraceae bacterium]|nr:hypothetical protein [Syntrophobacteraceae bacterium]